MKKKCLGLLFLISLAGPAVAQTIDWRPYYQLSHAYDSFFGVTYQLMQLDPPTLTQRYEARVGPNSYVSYELILPRCRATQPEQKRLDNWLMERHFSPSDIKRIENTVFRWCTDRQLVFAPWSTAHDARCLITGVCPVGIHQKLAEISLDAGAKLEKQLDDGELFHNMIQTCFHRLLLVPEYYDHCSFPPPKPRRT